jgi:glycosyltransferase involved in cell wall biosynthesis
VRGEVCDGPLVSVILPTWNAGATIANTLSCLIGQSYKNIELVVVDGGSTDATLEFVKNSGLRVVLKRQVGRGIWGAINEALEIASGDFLLSLNADDLISSHAITELVRISTSSAVDCVWLPTYSAGGLKNSLAFERRWLGMDRVTPGHSASFFISSDFQYRLGKYDEDIKFCADHELFYRAFSFGARLAVVTDSRSCYGIFTHGGFSAGNEYIDKVIEEWRFRKARSLKDVHDFIFCMMVVPLKLAWSVVKKARRLFSWR